MKAAIITIGDELLNGQTLDTNAAWIGQQLNKIGMPVSIKLSVGDERSSIIEGLDYAYQEASLVIVTGGLGPTHDDITKKVLAEYFNDEMVFDEETFNHIESFFKRSSNHHMTEAHRLQCFMPSKATLIKNKRGTAPGMWIEENDGRCLLSMPGVPLEMKGLMLSGGLERIAFLNPDQHIVHYIIQTVRMGETRIAERIADILESFPQEINIAYLPGLASVKLRLTGIGTNHRLLNKEVERLGGLIIDRLGSAVYAIGEKTLEEVVGQVAQQAGIIIGTAESCTGGYIAQLITSVSGSSLYFKGSVVAYANEVKTDLLKVSPDTLKNHGAVSESTVKEMVSGLIALLDIDIAVAVSGIAGPGGGTPEKPVGTIWIAVGNKYHVETKKLQLNKNRDLNIRYTAVVALDLLRKFMHQDTAL